MSIDRYQDDAHTGWEAAFEAMYEKVRVGMQEHLQELLAEGQMERYEAVTNTVEFIKDSFESIAAELVAQDLIRKQPEDQA